MYPEIDFEDHDEMMGSLDGLCSEETPNESVQNFLWRPRCIPSSAAALACSSNESNSSSEESTIIVPETPSPYLNSKRRFCDSDSNSPKRVCWSGTGDDEGEEKEEEAEEAAAADSSIPSSTQTTPFGPLDRGFREISLAESMNTLLCQDSSSLSNELGGTSASTEDEEELAPLRTPRRRTLILSSDDSDLDLALGSPRQLSSSSSGSSTSNTAYNIRRPVANRRSQASSCDRLSRGFPQSSSSSGERSGGTVFHGRRCRQRTFLGKKHRRGREASSSPSSGQGCVEAETLPLQQDLSSPHTPRRSRIFSSRRYHHVSPRARLEERIANSASGGMFSSSPTFRRDDPGRRPLTRSSHSSQGRRVVPPNSPQSRDTFCNYTRSMPDVFDADSDESTEFFTASSHSESEDRRRRVSGSPSRPSVEVASFASDSGLRGGNRVRRRSRFSVTHVPVSNDNSDDDVRVVFPGNFTSTTFHPSPSGRRQRRGTRSRRRHVSSEREISSPDPVQQVQQMEEDERMARMLQAQFDAEMQARRFVPPAVDLSEDDVNIVVDQESSEGSTASSETSTFSSESSASSSRTEENVGQPYARRLRRNVGGNWRRRGTTGQRNWQIPRNVRRATQANPLINILEFSISQSGIDDYDYEALWDLVQVVGDVVPRGLLPQQLNRLPTRRFGEVESKSKECQVCLSEFENQELLRILPCFHEFHAACIDKWLPMNRTCPVCRAEVEVN